MSGWDIAGAVIGTYLAVANTAALCGLASRQDGTPADFFVGAGFSTFFILFAVFFTHRVLG